MRFVIYGAGGIGGTIGARLFQSGEEVAVIARGAHFETMRREGLRLRSPEEDVRLIIPVVGHPREIAFKGDEVVIVCVKSQHTVGALEDLRAATGDTVAVVCCQNGVANEREALRRFSNVYGMVVMLPALHLTPGEVVTYATGISGVLDVGRYPAGIDNRAVEIAARLTKAGFLCEPDATVMRQKYAKLLMNLNNALQAATPMGEGTEGISRALRDEALACYRAAGIESAAAEEVRTKRRLGPRIGDVQGVRRGGGSSWQSVARGAGDIETDYLNGEIVLLGRLHGVPTPANAMAQRLGQELIQRKLPAGSLSIAEINARFAASA